MGLTDDATNTIFSTTTLTATGTPNYGTYNIPLSFTAANGPAYPIGYSGENLIGNPYASAITLSDITITNALSTVDVYDYTIDNYKTLSGSDIIGPYQGFWAYAQGSGASFTILETSKSTNTSTALHRITNDSEQPYLNLMLSCADGSHTMAHTLKIACDASAKDGWDAEDHPFRRSLNPKAPNITAAVGQMNLSISTFNNDHETYLMPLDLQVGIDGMYQLNRSGMSAVTKDFATVILEDKFMKKFIDLSSSSNYTFFARTTDAKQRFVLHFSKSSDYKPAPSSIENNYENAVKIFQTLNGNMVSFNFSQTENAAISVMDLLGKNIIEKQYVNASNQNITIYLSDNFHGMYLISVESASGSIVKKFIAP
ncbi:MAG TPA: T9SS type A sorting domain-containing protein [Bacteroidia bacterium]|nr:T9SS type A sorting domain-containing protein [Bacteroidia bacterium]